MQSFRTELENPIVEQDIIDLERKIRAFREGKIHDEKFRSLRLARGVYGQRQPGVQMVRIKLPFGKVTFKQLLKIADISDEYGSGNLHLTTRQDIQIHYVSLDRTPQLWAELERDDITLREACGNTVRNVTSSPTSGIDPKEPFDVSPYADAMFRYFLRNPICQEMGRKFKISFSANDDDTAFSYIHDLGFIPKINENGERGFKVMLGGGLGAQPLLASPVEDFLPEDQLIPYAEAIIRVFDRHGERNNRNKARLKYLIQKIGLEEVLRLAKEERIAIKVKTYPINREAVPAPALPETTEYPTSSGWLPTFSNRSNRVSSAYILKYPLAISLPMLPVNWLMPSAPTLATRYASPKTRACYLNSSAKRLYRHCTRALTPLISPRQASIALPTLPPALVPIPATWVSATA
jgi:sulfite reductase (ferredoxin)